MSSRQFQLSVTAGYAAVGLAFALTQAATAQIQHNRQIAPLPELAEASRQFEAKHYTDASALCETVAKNAIDEQVRIAAQLLEAKAEINLDHFAAAETLLKTYLAGKPQSAEALYLQGYVLQRENKARDSSPSSTEPPRFQPPQANDLKLVALDYVLLEDYPDAVQWLKRSLASDPSNAEAWYFLGRALMQGGDFKAAERDFRESLRLRPGDAKSLDNLGLSLEAQNRNEDALVAYKQAVEIPAGGGSGKELPFLDYATLLNNENRSSEALPYLRHAVELTPRNVRGQDELSRAEVATGDLSSGIRSMLIAISLDPSNPRLHFRLSQLYRKNGETAKADSEAQESARLYGTHSTDAKP